MKGDFTRSTFDRTKHYASVRWQQGRVQLDADWNEEMDILAHRDRTTRRDVIGLCGGPAGADADGNPLAGFLIHVDTTDGGLHVSPGRYYVDGVLVENEADVSILQQPDLPPLPGNTIDDVLVPPGTGLDEGTYLAFLDVWERHITALEDAGIRELALGGPDTATRSRVVWQVRLIPANTQDEVETISCATEPPAWQAVTGAGTGTLTARAEPSEAETDPCVVPAQAGYRGLENQLYRVEVHRLASSNEITVKWSRENGSVVCAWLDQDTTNPNRLTVESTGRDQVLGFAADDWVELTDEVRELRRQPGILVQIQAIEGNVLIIDPGGSTIDRGDFPKNPKVRRWDMPSEVGEISVDPSATDHWMELENGVQVRFGPGTYRSGDHWLIPARTANRDIEWPRDDAKDPLPQPPHGIHHHYCRLALVHFDGETWSRLSDCRHLFPPLTELVRFFHVGGDGQEAMPGQFLPRPLQVGVSNGQWPVEGARVAFEIMLGNGRLQAPGVATAPRIVVETDANGIAQCRWRLDAGTVSQQVEATLLDMDGKPFLDADGGPQITPLHFNANLSIASRIAYDPRNCADLSEAQTVQDAIDILCARPQGGCCVTVGRGGTFEELHEAVLALLEQGERDICICLLAGEHETIGPSITLGLEARDLHITLYGCGLASRLILTDKPWLLRGVKSVTLRDLAIEPAFQVDNEEGAISFHRCSRVTVTGCAIHGFTSKGPLLSITDGDQVRLRDNLLEAGRPGSLESPQKIFATAKVRSLSELFALPAQGEIRHAAFRAKAAAAAKKLASLGRDERSALRAQIGEALDGVSLSSGELLAFAKLLSDLADKVMDPANVLDLILDIRRAAIKARPGLALVLGESFLAKELPGVEMGVLDDDDLISVESNEIAGVTSLYGLPAPPELLGEALTEGFLKDLGEQLKERIRLNGLLGTLNVRGNHLVQVTVTAQVIQALIDALSTDNTTQLFGLFGRCLFSDNVFEGGRNLIISQHMAMTSNDFASLSPPGGTDDNLVIAATVIADTSVYTGNHGGGRTRVRDVSRATAQAANLELNIT
jgi:hypothetical protein